MLPQREYGYESLGPQRHHQILQKKSFKAEANDTNCAAAPSVPTFFAAARQYSLRGWMDP
jgi:hypothetical protein